MGIPAITSASFTVVSYGLSVERKEAYFSGRSSLDERGDRCYGRHLGCGSLVTSSVDQLSRLGGRLNKRRPSSGCSLCRGHTLFVNFILFAFQWQSPLTNNTFLDLLGA